MKLSRLLLLVVVGLIVFGCSTVQVANRSIPEVKEYIIPSIGNETTAYIGDQLLNEGTTCSDDAVYLLKSFGSKGLTTCHAVGLYKFVGTTNIGDRIFEGSVLTTNGWTSAYPQIVEKSDGRFYRKGISGDILLQNSEFRKDKYVFDASKEFQQTLIYTGSNGSTLNFTYREFSNSMARPAYTIDATYDLSNGNIIRYKGASLEIINVDNQSITYKVISGFNN